MLIERLRRLEPALLEKQHLRKEARTAAVAAVEKAAAAAAAARARTRPSGSYSEPGMWQDERRGRWWAGTEEEGFREGGIGRDPAVVDDPAYGALDGKLAHSISPMRGPISTGASISGGMSSAFAASDPLSRGGLHDLGVYLPPDPILPDAISSDAISPDAISPERPAGQSEAMHGSAHALKADSRLGAGVGMGGSTEATKTDAPKATPPPPHLAASSPHLGPLASRSGGRTRPPTAEQGLRMVAVPLDCSRGVGGGGAGRDAAARTRGGGGGERRYAETATADACCVGAARGRLMRAWRVATVDIAAAGGSRALQLQHLQALRLVLHLHPAATSWPGSVPRTLQMGRGHADVATLLPSSAQAAVRLRGGRWRLHVPNLSVHWLSLCRHATPLSLHELTVHLGMLPPARPSRPMPSGRLRHNRPSPQNATCVEAPEAVGPPWLGLCALLVCAAQSVTLLVCAKRSMRTQTGV